MYVLQLDSVAVSCKRSHWFGRGRLTLSHDCFACMRTQVHAAGPPHPRAMRIRPAGQAGAGLSSTRMGYKHVQFTLIRIQLVWAGLWLQLTAEDGVYHQAVLAKHEKGRQAASRPRAGEG